MCKTPVYRSTQDGVYACVRLHYWVRCPLHGTGILWYWSGVSNTAEDVSRKCQCHRDDPNIQSEQVKVEWWTTNADASRYTNILATEIMPRELLSHVPATPNVVVRTLASSDSDVDITSSRAVYDASTFLVLYPHCTWEWLQDN